MLRKSSSHKHAFVECATINNNVGAHFVKQHKNCRQFVINRKERIYVNFKSLMQMSFSGERAFIVKKTAETKDEQLRKKKKHLT